MPDPQMKTVSATQVAALFNLSPYETRWMLHQQFRGVEVERETERMTWGKRLEPIILYSAADELRIEITSNEQAEYVRGDELPDGFLPIGCTVDAHFEDPEFGLTVIEAKNVDWLQWKEKWSETAAPPHIELQVQAQMAVLGATFGYIACLIGGNELRLYRREIDQGLIVDIANEARGFLHLVETDNAPEPFGEPIEIPYINKLWPAVEPAKVYEYAPEREAEIAETINRFRHAKDQESFYKKMKEGSRAKLLGWTEDAEIVKAGGLGLEIGKTEIAETTSTRKAHVRTNLKVHGKLEDRFAEDFEG